MNAYSNYLSIENKIRFKKEVIGKSVDNMRGQYKSNKSPCLIGITLIFRPGLYP